MLRKSTGESVAADTKRVSDERGIVCGGSEKYRCVALDRSSVFWLSSGGIWSVVVGVGRVDVEIALRRERSASCEAIIACL